MRIKDHCQIYLRKYNVHPPDFLHFGDEARLIIAIPCYNEVSIISSLESLMHNDFDSKYWGIIIVINHSVEDSEKVILRNQQTYDEIVEWSKKHYSINVAITKAYDLPHKKAGVGLARKIGMDWACQYFYNRKIDGIIQCFDADSHSSPDLLSSVAHCFSTKGIDGLSIHYEHPLEGDQYDESVYHSITQYEMHLRYFITMQRRLSLPYAYHTVGSSMAVRSSSYAKFGGMNQRKAGEDFYFFQKIIDNGNVAELNTAMVIPSPRLSDRVPFGTGKAVGDMLQNNLREPVYCTYSPESFYMLNPLIEQLSHLYAEKNWMQVRQDLHPIVVRFFDGLGIEAIIEDCRSNTASLSSFVSRFYHHFNAFQLMKYLHHMRDHGFKDIPVLDGIRQVFGNDTTTPREALILLRNWQREGRY